MTTKLIPYKKTPAARKWLREETAAQRERYREISHQMNEATAPQRKKRIDAFLERIQARGYSVHYDQLRRIAPEEMPREPRRKHRVVF